MEDVLHSHYLLQTDLGQEECSMPLKKKKRIVLTHADTETKDGGGEVTTKTIIDVPCFFLSSTSSSPSTIWDGKETNQEFKKGFNKAIDQGIDKETKETKKTPASSNLAPDEIQNMYLIHFVAFPDLRAYSHLRTLFLNHCTCRIDEITFLPETLTFLCAEGVQLRRLPPRLPNAMTKLWVGRNQLTKLPPMNDEMLSLDCNNNELTYLPYLGKRLQKLICFRNKIRKISGLPPTLQYFYCCKNPLTKISSLPDGLKLFDCASCLLETLPRLPMRLSLLVLYENPFRELVEIVPFVFRCYLEYVVVNLTPREFCVWWNDRLFQRMICDNGMHTVKMQWFWSLRDKVARRVFHPDYVHEAAKLPYDKMNSFLDTWDFGKR